MHLIYVFFLLLRPCEIMNGGVTSLSLVTTSDIMIWVGPLVLINMIMNLFIYWQLNLLKSSYSCFRKWISNGMGCCFNVLEVDPHIISDVLLWTPTYGRAKAGRPTRTYIQQLCEDTGCSLEDLPKAMDNREKGRERARDICAAGATWWLRWRWLVSSEIITSWL